MFADLNSDLPTGIDNFYSPISASGYLTPLQRKKLREKRKIDISSDFENEFVTPTNTKKVFRRNEKLLHKVHSAKSLFKKKPTPDSRSISSDLLVKGNPESSTKDKKFFKSRSPQHLKKAKFSMPLTYKKKYLNFGNLDVRQNIVSKATDISQNDTCMNESALTEKVQKCVLTSPNPSSNMTPGPLAKDTVETAKCSTLKPKNLFDDTKDNSSPEVTGENLVNGCEKGIFDFDWPSDEDLMERRNRAISEMKKSILPEHCDQELKENVEGQHTSPSKLYPIFLKQKRSEKEPESKRPCIKKSPMFIKDSSSGGEQMFIDAGQKEIGAKVCPTCNMIYTIAQEEDETLHAKYHETYLINLKFPGWKEEHVVGDYDDGRVILVKETDKHFKLKKVEDVLFIANRDLGFSSASYPSKPNVMFFLFISNEKRVCGCLVAETIESACPVVASNEGNRENGKTIWELGNWYASDDPVDAICGINRIWVSKSHRRRKVASRLVDCLRHNFLFGHVIDFKELAFTDPSPDGRQFAASYTGTDNFLVYK